MKSQTNIVTVTVKMYSLCNKLITKMLRTLIKYIKNCLSTILLYFIKKTISSCFVFLVLGPVSFKRSCNSVTSFINTSLKYFLKLTMIHNIFHQGKTNKTQYIVKLVSL